ncbi:hypothetical protein, partial [Streptomyces sp. NPDC093589]|uniref:hypothetical protein n=1 Tax=Streptomyces sp. NPDC093589 TaxID=3366043 RepID=UPI0037F5F393
MIEIALKKADINPVGEIEKMQKIGPKRKARGIRIHRIKRSKFPLNSANKGTEARSARNSDSHLNCTAILYVRLG